jgi:hypothetical protein
VKNVGALQPNGGKYFAAPFKAFQGNSGGGVFSEEGELIGILLSGAKDFVEETDPITGEVVCESLNFCEDQGADDHPLSDEARVEEILGLQGQEFVEAIISEILECGGEWSLSSGVLGPFLTELNGCSSDDDCRYGGTCSSTGECDCPESYYGADCSQARSRAFCNGVGENTGKFSWNFEIALCSVSPDVIVYFLCRLPSVYL